MAVVEDTQENMEICKRFCGTCPTYQANRMKESPPHALFCARGKSAIADKAENKGCNCFQCEVFKKYNLKGGFFCLYGNTGPK